MLVGCFAILFVSCISSIVELQHATSVTSLIPPPVPLDFHTKSMISSYSRNLISTLNKESLGDETTVVVATPVKGENRSHRNGSVAETLASSPFTPHSSDHLFQSVPRVNMQSSPPEAMASSPMEKSRKSNLSACSSVASTPLKLSLQIGANGKAALISPGMFKNAVSLNTASSPAASSVPKEKAQTPPQASQAPEKTKILSLLKRMRSTTSSLNSSPVKNSVKKPQHHNLKKAASSSAVSSIESKRSRRPSSSLSPATSLVEITNKLHTVPQVTVTSSPKPPSTPRAKHTQFRTGFTPSVGLDLVLSNSMSPRMFFANGGGNNESSLDDRILKFSSPGTTFSPKTRVLPKPTSSQAYQQQQYQQQQHQQFPFKYSCGDPLLMNDVENGNWFEVMNNHTGTSAPSTLLLASPKPQVTTFTSPSHMDKRLRPITSERAKGQMEPATPRDTTTMNTAALQFTPLIQQTMNGSLSSKVVASTIALSPVGVSDRRSSLADEVDTAASPEKDDARLSLKRLINRS